MCVCGREAKTIGKKVENAERQKSADDKSCRRHLPPERRGVYNTYIYDDNV